MGIDRSRFEIEQLDPERHDRTAFRCGVDRLDNYLKRNAKDQHRSELVRTYVAVESGAARVLGYLVLNAGELDASSLAIKPRNMPPHGKLPVVYLSRIAVDATCQGSGLGAMLMVHALIKTAIVADQVGCFGVMLDVFEDGGPSTVERRRSWYSDFGFEAFPSNPLRMFMTIESVRAHLAALGLSPVPKR